MRPLLVLLLALSGCLAPHPDMVSVGLSVPIGNGLSDATLNDSHSSGSGEPVAVTRLYCGPAWEIGEGPYYLDLGILTTVTFVTGHESGGPGIGGEVALRPRYDFGTWEPYVKASAGFEIYTDRIGEQGTNWGFPLAAGVGARFELKEGLWLTAEFTLWHESNGAKVFGHGRYPNPGYNGDLLTVGAELEF